MKKFICIYILILLSLASCNGASIPMSTNTPTPSNTPLPTETLTPTITPTRTPRPSATPPRELTAADVGLPWNVNSVSPDIPVVKYKPCYVDAATRWHAGDAFIWNLKTGQVIDVVSPVEGEVVYILENWSIKGQGGGNIFVRTPYLLGGKTVYYQLRHSSTFDDNIQVGVTVSKGQHIGTLRWDGPPASPNAGNERILDFMLLRGDDWNYDSTTEAGRNKFFDTAPYHLDDLNLIEFQQLPRCEGNPK